MPKKRKLAAKHAKATHSSKPSSSDRPPAKKQKTTKAHRQTHHVPLPFNPHERILLLGEGDLSFAASLVKHYRCTNVVATVLEKSEEELVGKYPAAKDNIGIITGPLEELPEDEKGDVEGDEEGWEEDYGSDWDDDPDAGALRNKRKEEKRENQSKVLYNIDVTKPLPSAMTRHPVERVIFNFPHTGGLSTDVNRQVRANQELLVKFFEATQKVLSDKTSSSDSSSGAGQEGKGGAAPAAPVGKPAKVGPPTAASITVTLFESEPYTLWNVRDLARHCSLVVDRSFAFDFATYPGYHHARTCGVIKGKDGKEGGWKGEERGARSYVFVKKEVPKEKVVQDYEKFGTGANAVGEKKKTPKGGDVDDDGGDSDSDSWE